MTDKELDIVEGDVLDIIYLLEENDVVGALMVARALQVYLATKQVNG